MSQATLDELLALVHAHPDDDEPRLVYADALMQRGDPHGEFIARQLGARWREDRKQRKLGRARLEALLAAHARGWLGPLHPILLPDFTFERGFLARCTVSTARADRLIPVEGHPLWATVHTLSGALRIALHPVMGALRTLTVDMSRAFEVEGLTSPWESLLDGASRPIRALVYRPSRAASELELELLGTCSALPELESLAINDERESVLSSLLWAPVLHRLRSLSLSLRGEPPECVDALIAAALVPELSLSFDRVDLTFVLTRLAGEGYAAGVTVRSAAAIDALSQLVQRLPRLRWAEVRSSGDGRWWEQAAVDVFRENEINAFVKRQP